MTKYDVIVVGLGAMGSATAYRLAEAGAKVLGIDRFSPPHKFGSSHGDTRITRGAIGEGVEYSELALRSHKLWREIEAATGKTLFVRNGCLTISGADAVVMHDVDDFFANVATAARRYDIPHKMFPDAAAIRARYPQFAAKDGDQAILDEEAGYLFLEACIAAQLELAERAGAALLRDTQVTSIEPAGGGVEVSTADGQRFIGDRVLIATGAWLPRFVADELKRHFTVTRQVLHWFEIKQTRSASAPRTAPCSSGKCRRRTARRAACTAFRSTAILASASKSATRKTAASPTLTMSCAAPSAKAKSTAFTGPMCSRSCLTSGRAACAPKSASIPGWIARAS